MITDLAREQKAREYFSSQAIIDTCRPFPWRNEFPRSVRVEPALEEPTLSQWNKLIDQQ